ncbi:MAG TPA: hypothetical protein VHZ74_10705 [Bryobacteraceae bacterium]|jgi:hypothetical protein|nr:hypothetical protein [Bryobacteraceae bacterium]
MANVFQKFFGAVESFFTRGKAKEVVDAVEADLAKVADILPHAIPIVEDIAALTPNRTVQEVSAVLTKYVGPVAQQIDDNPAAIGNILLNTATAAVQKNLPPELAGAATRLIQTGVQMAVVAVNAQPASPVPAAK